MLLKFNVRQMVWQVHTVASALQRIIEMLESTVRPEQGGETAETAGLRSIQEGLVCGLADIVAEIKAALGDAATARKLLDKDKALEGRNDAVERFEAAFHAAGELCAQCNLVIQWEPLETHVEREQIEKKTYRLLDALDRLTCPRPQGPLNPTPPASAMSEADLTRRNAQIRQLKAVLKNRSGRENTADE